MAPKDIFGLSQGELHVAKEQVEQENAQIADLLQPESSGVGDE